MAIRRTALAFEQNFTRIPNDWVRDARLSYRARGVLAMMMSHSDGWEISTDAIVNGGTEGRDAIRSTIKELEELGYLTREVAREGGRFGGTDYVITEPSSPAPENPSTVANPPAPEKPAPVKPAPVNPHLRRTSFLEDHLEEDHSVTADAVTGGEDAQPEALPFTVAKADAPRTPEEWVAKRAYDGTSGALNFMAIKGIAKWAIHTKGCHPTMVDAAIRELYHGGRAVTKQTVAQRLDGIIKANGGSRPDKMDKIRNTLSMPLTDAPALGTTPFEPQLRITS